MVNHNLSEVSHVVAVAAGKGGVGKSTLTLNLALALKKKGFQVGVMDADLYGPSLSRMLPPATLATQHPAIAERIIPALKDGIKLMSMAFFLHEKDPASVRAPIANGVIKQFIHLVEWGKLDYLLIDFPPGTGDIQLTLIQEGCLSGAVLVTTPQEIALLDVARALAMLRQMRVPVVGLVENMSWYQTEGGVRVYPFGQGGGEQFALQEEIFFLGSVPLEPLICRTCDAGISLFEAYPTALAASILMGIADQVAQQLEAFKRLEC